jgi:toxin-antitoxin system PIN domain toxin
MLLVDTNILVHAGNAQSPEHRRCADKLSDLARGTDALALTWPVIYEFLRVATHPRVFQRPLSFADSWAKVTALLSSPGCALLEQTANHMAVLEQCAAEVPRLRGNLVHDFHLAVLMREHGVTDILTLDRGFRAFPWVTIREP